MSAPIAHTPEDFASANGMKLCYDTFGDRSAPTVMLIMGLGAQMILWDDGFCGRLAARGFHVVRFDNRDIGRSSRVDVPVKIDFADRPIRCATWRRMRPACSIIWESRRRMSSARRWAA